MFKYYQLRLSSDPSVIGVRNGVQQVEIQNFSSRGTSSQDEIINFFSREAMTSEIFVEPKFIPDFPCVKPLNKAIFTDFLSYGPYLPTCPFMISESAANVLKLFNLQDHRLYDVKFTSDTKKVGYKILYCPALGYDVVDFQKSLFYLGGALTGKQYLSFKSSDEYKNFLTSNRTKLVRVDKLKLNSNFDDSLDLVVLKFGGVFVSSGLHQEISLRGLTGANFIPSFEKGIEDRMICL